MKTAAIYNRVSTDNQEAEGTSLQTQLEACLKYCQDKGYDVRHRFSEAYSGLTLERPKLNELRELVRAGEIDVIVVYCLDRLSRDPTHGVILTQELEKHGVKLEAVTEDIDNSELGKLISYIRGFASKLEAEKIRERTIRGKKERAKQGRIPGGSGATIYGYDYIPVSQKDGGRRVINKEEARWVKQAYDWLVFEGLSTNQILYRLRAHNAPTKSGKPWNRRSVQAILKNPAYTGKTYVFTTAKGGKQFTRPKGDWIEIPGVTPRIISQEIYDAGQVQLKVNQAKAPRNNTVHQYLLRSRLRCRQCGRAYAGGTGSGGLRNGKRYIQRCYRCMGTRRMYAPFERCHNKGWSAKKLESLVWAKLEEYLSKPELIVKELERQRQDAGELGIFETQLQDVERQLKAVDREQHQLLQWALKGFPESQVEAENRRLNQSRETLTAQKAELETQIKASRDAAISIPKLESFIERMRSRIGTLDFEGKRQVLDMLNITIWLDGETIEITGVLPVTDDVIVHTQS
jgi:site-specific DNA recombinase